MFVPLSDAELYFATCQLENGSHQGLMAYLQDSSLNIGMK